MTAVMGFLSYAEFRLKYMWKSGERLFRTVKVSHERRGRQRKNDTME